MMTMCNSDDDDDDVCISKTSIPVSQDSKEDLILLYISCTG